MSVTSTSKLILSQLSAVRLRCHFQYQRPAVRCISLNCNPLLSSSTSSQNQSPSLDDQKSKPQPMKKPKTPVGLLDDTEYDEAPLPMQTPIPAFPNNTNPDTGEIGGPRGPEPTRYGDWERKGRVSDF